MNLQLHDFEEIRPIAPEELPAAFDELLSDSAFCEILRSFYPNVPIELLKARIYSCKNNLEVQLKILYPLVKDLVAKCTDGLQIDAESFDADARKGSFTFVSNHRDIVLDSALLSLLIIDNGFRTTTEIAIGDNLLIYPWIKTLVRVNKSFIVKRSVSMREMLASSKLMSEYMHFAISEKHENIWIAQREGRAKDSDDRTQESVLKMMAIGGEGTPIERLKALNIVPLAISYEYDPCDFLKAKEFQQKRDDASFKKSRADDLQNMKTGIFGYKGRVQYRLARPINTWIDELESLPKAQLFVELARRMDTEIHKNYEIFPSNHVALDLLRCSDAQSTNYTAEDKARFETYLAQRIAMVDLPHRDETFLRERILTMYANPLINHLAAKL